MKNLQVVPVKMIVLPSWDPMSSSVYTTTFLLRGTLVDALAVPLAPAKEQNNTYALNLGAVSKENCYAMYLPYAKQTEAALVQLKDWHKENASKLEIDVESTRRKRQGTVIVSYAVYARIRKKEGWPVGI